MDDGYEYSPGAKGVRNIFVSDVFDVGKKMLFLFDYGDGLEFIVECIHISHAVPRQRYPQIFTKIGCVPRQYR